MIQNNESLTGKKYTMMVVSIIPLLIAATSLKLAAIIGTAYFVLMAITILMSMLSRFFVNTTIFFMLESILYALSLVFVSGLIRIISPISFELLFAVLFFFPFTLPVLNIMKEGTRSTDFDWTWAKVSQALFFFICILATGMIRELLGNGSISLAGQSAGSKSSFLPIFLQPAGLFFLLGISFMIVNLVTLKLRSIQV